MTGTWLTIYANSTQHDTHREKDTQPETIKIDMKNMNAVLSLITLFSFCKMKFAFLYKVFCSIVI